MYCRIFGTDRWHKANVNALSKTEHDIFSIKFSNTHIWFSVTVFCHKNKEYKICRPASVYSSDYIDFNDFCLDYDFACILNKEMKRRQVSALLFSNIVCGSYLHNALHVNFHHKVDIDCVPTFGILCPRIQLAEYFNTLSKGSSRNLNRIRKKCIDFKVDYHYRRFTIADLHWLIHHQAVRSDKMGYDEIKNSLVSEILLQLIPDDTIYFAYISHGNDIMAGMVVLDFDNTLGIYLQAFDSDFSKLYPSLYLLTELVNFSIHNKYNYIDMLRGEEPYKVRFCNNRINLAKVIIKVDEQIEWIKVIELCKNLIE